jgi:hypothetical protein
VVNADTRSPLDLLVSAVPGWAKLLKPGGAIGLAHRVDQAINRDVLVARKVVNPGNHGVV